MISDAKSAPAVVNLPFVALQFISGVWISVTLLPSWLVTVSQVFPLHWICRGMRAVFLPDSFTTVETGGTWQLGTAAIVLRRVVHRRLRALRQDLPLDPRLTPSRRNLSSS